MLILYITEVVPDNKRATWQGITAAVGAVAVLITACMCVPSIQADGTVMKIPWRMIYIIIVHSGCSFSCWQRFFAGISTVPCILHRLFGNACKAARCTGKCQRRMQVSFRASS